MLSCDQGPGPVAPSSAWIWTHPISLHNSMPFPSPPPSQGPTAGPGQGSGARPGCMWAPPGAGAQGLGPLHGLLASSGFQRPDPRFPAPHFHPRSVEGPSAHGLHEYSNGTHDPDVTQAVCWLPPLTWPMMSPRGEHTGPPANVSGGPGSRAQPPALRICSGRLHRTSVSRAPEPEVHERSWE